jgi:hypothetical protein
MTDRPSTKRGPVKPVAYAYHTIKLHDGVNSDDFEKHMLGEVFPALDTSEEGEAPDQHFLLGSQMFGDDYVWMSRLEYWIHHDPLPTWLGQRVERHVQEVKEKIEPFGTITSSTTYYDVTGWRARLKR